MIHYAAMTDAGICEKNDDRVMVNGEIIARGSLSGEAESEIIATVCDGVGGYAFGDEAAAIASKVFAALAGGEVTQERIVEAVSRANDMVVAAQRVDADHKRMSSTVAGVFLCGGNFITFNAGDSKVFRFRAPYIAQLSVDHTHAHEALTYGLIDSVERADERDRNTITRWIGDAGGCEPSVAAGENRVLAGDVFLLCSDGLSDVVSVDELEIILSGSVELSEKCRALFQTALRNGSVDNISIILLEVA